MGDHRNVHRVEGMRQRADKLQALRAEVERIRVTETSAYGAVVVTVDSNGSPVDIRFDRASAVRPEDLGLLVMACLRAARARITAHVQAVTEETVGGDLPDTRRMVVDSYRERFGEAAAPPRRTTRDDDDFVRTTGSNAGTRTPTSRFGDPTTSPGTWPTCGARTAAPGSAVPRSSRSRTTCSRTCSRWKGRTAAR
ncbi:YbaB/EbfC family nucleoid-associated protein [Saccharothrix isguenensis]